MNTFNTSVYVERRLELMQKVGSGIILLTGNKESARNFKSNTFFFVQDSSFLYYIGIDQPNLLAILDCDSQEVILFGNEKTLEYMVWMGFTKSLQELAASSGIKKVLSLDKIQNYLTKHNSKLVHYLPPYKSSAILQVSKILGQDYNQVQTNYSLPLIKAIISQREFKQDEELKELDEAVTVSRLMHLEVINNVKPNKYEHELVGVLESTALSQGRRAGYSPILSVEGHILHNFNYSNKLKEGQLILGDFGGVSKKGYAGDITRTVPVSGKFTTKQKEIYQIVLNAQEKAIALLKPNVPFKDIHLESCKVIVDGLKDLGLMKGDTEEAVNAGAHALFFPHGLGHMIGLDVHDMENLGEDFVGYDNTISRSNQFGLKSLRLGKSLKERFAITVEPGIYFIPMLIDNWKDNKKCNSFLNYAKIEDYKDFSGIRIEDQYVITKDGSRLLGKYIPKTISEIEQIM